VLGAALLDAAYCLRRLWVVGETKGNGEFAALAALITFLNAQVAQRNAVTVDRVRAYCLSDVAQTVAVLLRTQLLRGALDAGGRAAGRCSASRVDRTADARSPRGRRPRAPGAWAAARRTCRR
jgi:hypothetical protein